MGFLEDLRRRKEVAGETRGQYEEKRHKEVEELKAKFMASEKQFGDSGLKDLIDELFKINPKLILGRRSHGGIGDVNYIRKVILSGSDDVFSYGGNIMPHYGYERSFEIVTNP